MNVKEITLRAGEKGTVTFFEKREAPQGRYDVQIEGRPGEFITGAFDVFTKINPADLRFTNLRITHAFLPDSARPGQPVTITMDVENTGQQAGRTEIEFRINGVLFELRSVVVPGNGSVEVTFEFIPPVPGDFTIEMIDPEERIAQSLTGAFTAEPEVFEAEAEFSNLQISPVEADPGEEITVTVVVTNIGEEEGTFTVDLLINDAVAATQDVTVGAFLSETVAFTVSRDEPGLYTVGIDGQTGTFRVLEGPEEPVLRLERVTTVPGTVAPNQNITIVVRLVNRFDVELSRALVLSLDGVEIQRREVTVGPGDSQEIRFTFKAPEDPGRHTADISGITFPFEVAREPIVEAVLNLVPPLDISPRQVFPGETVTITATLRNSGEEDGTTSVILRINGEVEARQSKTVPGNKDLEVSFEVNQTELGEYRVEVEATEAVEVKKVDGTFTVVTPLVLVPGSLKIDPTEVESGKPVTITVDVNNPSATDSSITISLTVDRRFIEERKVTVAAGQTVTETFSFTEETIGPHTVAIDGLTAEFTVIEKPVVAEPEPEDGGAGLIIVIVIVVLAVVGIGVYVYLWKFRGGPPPPVVWERIKESVLRFWNNVRATPPRAYLEGIRRIFRRGGSEG